MQFLCRLGKPLVKNIVYAFDWERNFNVLHWASWSDFFVLNLTDLGPFFDDFFQLFRICDIPFEVTAIRADIIV